MRKACFFVCAVVCGLGFSLATRADTITKKDGTVLEGEVIREDSDSITIKHKLGEIKILRDEVERVAKSEKVNLDNQFEAVRKETIQRLEALLAKADAAGDHEKAQALTALLLQVRTWSLKEGPKKPAPEKTPEPEKSRALDWDAVNDRLIEIVNDKSQTNIQLQKALEKFYASIEGKPCRFSGVLENAERPAIGSGDRITPLDIQATIQSESGRALRVTISKKDDAKKIEKAEKGDKVTIEGRLTTKGNSYSMTVTLTSVRIVSISKE